MKELELLIIRHGQSEADLLGVLEGRADFPLTALGTIQAEKMAEYVGKYYAPNLILSSPLKRAYGTAMALQKVIDCELIESEDLMEFNNGVLAGLSKEVAAIQYPLTPNGRPMHIPIQDGESELELRFRAEKILNKIVFDYSDYQRVAIISHGGLISNILKAFLGQPNNKDFAFSTGDTGIHLLELKDGLRIIRFLNKQEHLMPID